MARPQHTAGSVATIPDGSPPPVSPSAPGWDAGYPTSDSVSLLLLLVDAARDFAIFATDLSGTILTWNPGVRTLTGYEKAEFLGQDCAVLFTPEDREIGAPEQEREAARREGTARDERWHLRKDGTRFWGSGIMHALYADAEETQGNEAGSRTLHGFAKILRDQTREKLRDEELEAKVRERTAGQARVQRQLLGAQEQERRRISQELHDQTGQHLAGLALELARIERAAEATRDAAREATRAAGRAALTAREAAAHAEEAAAAAAQANALPEAGRLARLASEAARLAAIGGTDARAAATAAEAALSVVAEAAPWMARIRALVASLSSDIHRLAVDLRPTALDDLGLVAALRSCAEECAQRVEASVEFESIGLEESGNVSLRLPSEIETALFRIVQEALTNVTKHAAGRGLTRVGVTLQRVDGHVLATVEDDGPGFDPAAAEGAEGATGRRLGLSGMRERAMLLGGTLEVESTPGQGTTVFARLPVAAGLV